MFLPFIGMACGVYRHHDSAVKDAVFAGYPTKCFDIVFSACLLMPSLSNKRHVCLLFMLSFTVVPMAWRQPRSVISQAGLW